jgi:hypothetical protein
MRNYCPSYVEGTDNLRSSSFKEQACTEMHKKAMLLLKKQQLSSVVEYAPIAKAILEPRIDAVELERLNKKFDMAYFIAKENSFSKMPLLVNLEERHGVNISTKHKGDHTCAKLEMWKIQSFSVLVSRKDGFQTLSNEKKFGIFQHFFPDKQFTGRLDYYSNAATLTNTQLKQLNKQCLMLKHWSRYLYSHAAQDLT